LARLTPRPPLALAQPRLSPIVSVQLIVVQIVLGAGIAEHDVGEVGAVSTFALGEWVVCVVHIYSIALSSTQCNLNKYIIWGCRARLIVL